MLFRSFNGRFFAGAALAGLMLAAAGCQSDGGGVLNVGAGKQDPASAQQPAQTKVLASSLQAYCPKVTVRDGTAYFDSYARGGQGDQTKIVYQSSISDVTRDCSRSNGTLTMDVAVAGKVVPGPLAARGAVTLPIRIVVTRGTDVLYSKLYHYPVNISDLSAATQFVFNDPAVAVPEPTASNYQVFAGFDEGRSDAGAKAEKPKTPRKKKIVKKKAAAATAPAAPPAGAQTSISDIPR